MAVSSTAILDQIAKFIIYLSDAPSYWYSLNKSCNDEFHLARQFGMDRVNFEALLIAGNLAKYKGNSLCILVDRWESFLRGHHFSDLSPDFCSIEIEQKNITINHQRERFYVVCIGRIVDRTILKFEKQYQMKINPPRMNSLRIQQQALCRATDLAVANIYINQYQKGKRNVIMATSCQYSNKVLMQQNSLEPSQTGGLPYTTINFNDDINADHNCRRRQRTTMMINKDNVEMGKSWRW
jgi:hypothetical protein